MGVAEAKLNSQTRERERNAALSTMQSSLFCRYAPHIADFVSKELSCGRRNYVRASRKFNFKETNDASPALEVEGEKVAYSNLISLEHRFVCQLQARVLGNRARKRNSLPSPSN